METTQITPEFIGFNKIGRLSRECVVSEKIDGTNGSIYITPDLQFFVGSRTRWLSETTDNYGFYKWATDHKDELMTLGPGRHFGEWWGQGVQRNYGLKEKRFSLFNTIRWCLHGAQPQIISTDEKGVAKMQQELPACVGLVPVLWRGLFDTQKINEVLLSLWEKGSTAAPGFMNAEGIVVFHTAANVMFKKTIGNDGAKGNRAV